MKTIELTQGKVAIVDDEDYERVNKHKWCAKRNPDGRFYAVRASGVFNKSIRMHREIMGAPDGMEVDHINIEDTLDNRKSNLRLATHTQNGWNRKKHKDSTSGFKGVTWQSQARKWQAQIVSNGEYCYLGLFATAEDAARAYNEAAKRYHGEFARLNEV